MNLRQEIHDEIVRLQERVKFNHAMALHVGEEYEEYHIIAHTQQVVVDRLQYLLAHTDEASIHIPVQESKMNNVKSLAGTGKTYCQFEIEVSGGAWGQPQTISLVDTVSNGGCGGGTTTKLTKLNGFALPVAGVPAGRYTLQAKRIGGGCGEKAGAHIQFKFPAGMPSAVASLGNRSYGWAFETYSPELVARLSA